MEIKQKRASMIGGWHCEICGREGNQRTIIGHHCIPRKRMRKDRSLMVPDLCRLRCQDCESDRHRTFCYGNSPAEQRDVAKYDSKQRG